MVETSPVIPRKNETGIFLKYNRVNIYICIYIHLYIFKYACGSQISKLKERDVTNKSKNYFRFII